MIFDLAQDPTLIARSSCPLSDIHAYTCTYTFSPGRAPGIFSIEGKYPFAIRPGPLGGANSDIFLPPQNWTSALESNTGPSADPKRRGASIVSLWLENKTV